MKLDVKLFARARDIAGSSIVSLELPERATAGDVRLALAERFPEMRPLASRLLVAVDNDYAADSTRLSPASDVACFPPVSGG